MAIGKKGNAGDNNLSWNLAYLLLGAVFFSGMLYYIFGYLDGASSWEDYYAKQIALIIDSGKPGEVYLDVTTGTKIAIKNGKKINEIFNFDNENNIIAVSFRNNGGKSYSYFAELDVVNWRIEQVSGEIDANRLVFELREAQK